MNVVGIVTTVFDALFMFLIGCVGATSKDKKQMGICMFMIVIMVMNLLCIWG